MTEPAPELQIPLLNGQLAGDGISSDADLIFDPSTPDYDSIPEEVSEDPTSLIDQEVEKEPPLVRPDKPAKKNARTTAPTAIEWQDFIANILIRYATDYYLSFAFRGIDEEALTNRDLERIRLTKEERRRIAEPLAEFTSKTTIGKKYGRTMIAAAGSFESLVTLGMWVSRVNRVASKYRPKKVKSNVNSRQTEPDSGTYGTEQRPITIVPGRG